MKKVSYKIQDWAGNECFGGDRFKSFEDAWDFILSMVEDETELGEYYVVETKEFTEASALARIYGGAK